MTTEDVLSESNSLLLRSISSIEAPVASIDTGTPTHTSDMQYFPCTYYRYHINSHSTSDRNDAKQEFF